MRLQDSQANCGPLALRNALFAMGILRSTEELESLCRTDGVSGTTAVNLFRAASAIEGVQPIKIEESRPDVALLRLDAALRCGRSAILLVSDWSHYVAVIGALGTRTLIADSADSELVVSWGLATLHTNWACSSARKPFWGVTL